MSRLRKGRPRLIPPSDGAGDKRLGTDKKCPSFGTDRGIAEAAACEVDPRLRPFVAQLAELLVADLLRVAPQKR